MAVSVAHDGDVPSSNKTASLSPKAHGMHRTHVSSMSDDHPAPSSSASYIISNSEFPTLLDTRVSSNSVAQLSKQDPGSIETAQHASSVQADHAFSPAAGKTLRALPKNATSPVLDGQDSKHAKHMESNSPNAVTSAVSAIASSADDKVSPTISEAEKEVDLESGDRQSISLSKEGVTAEPAVPDANIVNWSGPDDPKNPMNWPGRLKWGNVAVISSITFLT